MLYSQSWKNFKSNFFQVHPNLASRDLKKLFFKKDERTPKFPFYWQCFPFKFKSHSHQTLSAQEIKDIDIIREWSCEMSCKFIMVIPNSCFPNCVLSSKYFYFVMLFIKLLAYWIVFFLFCSIQKGLWLHEPKEFGWWWLDGSREDEKEEMS